MRHAESGRPDVVLRHEPLAACSRARPSRGRPRGQNSAGRYSLISRLSSTLSSSAMPSWWRSSGMSAPPARRERSSGVASTSDVPAIRISPPVARAQADQQRRRARSVRCPPTPAMPNTSRSRTSKVMSSRSAPPVVDEPQALDLEHGLAGLRATGRSTRSVTSRPTIIRASGGLSVFAIVDRADDAPVAQHGAAVDEPEELVELVGDEDDRASLVGAASAGTRRARATRAASARRSARRG